MLKGLGTAGLGVGATLTGGCHYYYIVKGELMQTNEMFVEPFRRKSFLTWNINAGRGLDGVRDLARIAAVVKKADVAVTALQEIDRKTVRADGEDQFTALETLTGLKGIWCTTGTRSAGEAGMALFVKTEPAKTNVVDLPGGGKVLCADYPSYSVALLNLPVKDGDRAASVAKIIGLVEADRPLFLLGDWGEEPTSDLVQKLRRGFSVLTGFAKTYPADEPTSCVDYVALSLRHRMRFEHVGHEVLPEAVASDHRPVKVTAW